MSGIVVWLTGLPASGKSTLAARVNARLAHPAVILDSDELRTILEASSYATTDREHFYRVLARLAATLARQGLVVLVAATAQRRAHRDHARDLAPRFLEVFVSTPLEECARRDVKGLYAGAAAGEIAALPGVGVAYEPPQHPDIVSEGGHDERAVAAILDKIRGA